MTVPNFAKAKLRVFVERIDKLEDERKTIGGDINEVYAEAKGEGFDVKALRAVVRLYRQDAAARNEHQALLDLYSDALGLGGTPLAKAALERSEGKAPKPEDPGRNLRAG